MLLKKWCGALLLAIMVLSLLPAARPGYAQGGPRLASPNGPNAVGRTAYLWVDESREEVHTPDTGDKRELLVEVWYPAETNPAAAYSPYLEPAAADLWALQSSAPSERVRAIRSNAVLDAPIASAAAAYPVLIFDPGFSVMPRQYSALLEEFASQGYVVFAVSHPYITALTIFPDGRMIQALPDARLQDLWKPRNPMDAEATDVWAPDVRFVLEQIDQLNAGDPQALFAGRLDLSQIGMIGHSMGGRTVSQVCLTEARCVGVINLDGGYSAEVEIEFNKPYMMFLADNGVENLASMYRHSMEALASDYYVLMVPGTKHMSFSDTLFVVPLVFDQDKLPLPENEMYLGQVALIEYRAYTLAFFDKYLRHQDVALLDGPSDAHPLVFYLERDQPITPPTQGVAALPASLVKGANHDEIEVGEADVWTYEGKAGEVLNLSVHADHPAGTATAEQRIKYSLLDTMLVVRAPNGSLLAANDDAGKDDTNSALWDLTLPTDGTYRIEVRSWASQTGGVYTLLIDSSLK